MATVSKCDRCGKVSAPAVQGRERDDSSQIARWGSVSLTTRGTNQPDLAVDDLCDECVGDIRRVITTTPPQDEASPA